MTNDGVGQCLILHWASLTWYISCLSILVFLEDCGNQALSPVINQGDHSRPNIGVAGESVRLSN